MSAWLHLSLADSRWQVLATLRDQLLDDHGLRWREWEQNRKLVEVKRASHRAVYRVLLADLAVYIKHYPVHDFRSHLRQAMRASKARKEFDQVCQVGARGIPAIEPLAVGESSSGDSFLVTRELPNAEPLDLFVLRRRQAGGQARQPGLRQSLVLVLARLLAAMHDQGVRHRDLHPGNLLVQREEQGSLQLSLVDLYEVELGGALDLHETILNLTLINRWFLQRSDRVDRRRFLEEYLRSRRRLVLEPGMTRWLALKLESETRRSIMAFSRRRDRRCQRNNRQFRRLRNGEYVGWAVRDVPEAAVQRLAADPEWGFTRGPGVSLKDSPGSRVTVIDLGDGKPLVYKRFTPDRWTDPIVSPVRRPPGLRSWVNAHRLLDLGIPTARPLLLVQRRSWGLVGAEFLLTEMIPNAVDLYVFGQELLGREPKEQRVPLLAMIDQLARLLRELHRWDLSHRDLKAANILVDQSEKVFLVDLVGVERHGRLSRRRRVQNLARLNASFSDYPLLTRTDRLRFLRAYMSWGLHGKQGWKAWWRQIAEATRRKQVRNLRRGRPLA